MRPVKLISCLVDWDGRRNVQIFNIEGDNEAELIDNVERYVREMTKAGPWRMVRSIQPTFSRHSDADMLFVMTKLEGGAKFDLIDTIMREWSMSSSNTPEGDCLHDWLAGHGLCSAGWTGTGTSAWKPVNPKVTGTGGAP